MDKMIIINWLRKQCSSEKFVIRFCAKRIFDIAHTVFTVKKFFCDKQFRNIVYLKAFHPKELHQTTPTTKMNRYPHIFSACQEYTKEKENLRILSFGCSTGEEVLTLRNYFHDATVVGAEINLQSLKICRQHSVDSKIHFIKSEPDELEKYAPYDIIFCMAVFQRTPQLIAKKNITDLSKMYPFERFEEKVTELDKLLKVGGFLVIYFSQYDLMDTKISSNYEAYGNHIQDPYGTPMFDKNSKRVNGQIKRNSIFIKNKR